MLHNRPGIVRRRRIGNVDLPDKGHYRIELREVKRMAGIEGKAEEVFAKVKEVIIREARVDEASVTSDATMNDLYADSATRMSIGDELDREFDLGILDVDLAEDTTVQDIVDFILEQLGESE